MKRSIEPNTTRWIMIGRCFSPSAPIYSSSKRMRQLEVKLDRTTLPGSSDRIFQMEVNLRSVECAVSFIYNIRKTHIIQSTSEVPSVAISQSSSLPMESSGRGGQLYMIFKSKQTEYTSLISFATPLISSRDLIRRHKDMGIILCKAAYTHQAMKLTGFLMTMDQTKLTHTQWQIPVRTWL